MEGHESWLNNAKKTIIEYKTAMLAVKKMLSLREEKDEKGKCRQKLLSGYVWCSYDFFSLQEKLPCAFCYFGDAQCVQLQRINSRKLWSSKFFSSQKVFSKYFALLYVRTWLSYLSLGKKHWKNVTANLMFHKWWANKPRKTLQSTTGCPNQTW